MKVTLLGLDFALENMGCQALAYSFASIFIGLTEKEGIECSFDAIVIRPFNKLEINEKPIDISCLKIQYKKLSFWKNLIESFKTSDLIVDFTGGDSFSDIYGFKRFFMASVIKKIAIQSKTPFLLGPQTYGPYKRRFCRKFAGRIIEKSRWVFARDLVSQKLAEKISGREVNVTTDVAFSLPYKKAEIDANGKIKVGINVSGLLWNNGYSFATIPLSVDYKEYCRKIIEILQKSDLYQVYLIPHVGESKGLLIENDFKICEKLHEEFSDTILFSPFSTPMEAKGVISAMDVFVGARMHATIASFSTGVATIPFSYSRKFEGLYNNLGYEYIVQAQTETTGEAINNTLEWISNYKSLTAEVEKSGVKVRYMQQEFEKDMLDILSAINSHE